MTRRTPRLAHRTRLLALLAASLVLFVTACDDGGEETATDMVGGDTTATDTVGDTTQTVDDAAIAEVIGTYGDIAEAAYADSVAGAANLQTAVEEFLTSLDEPSLGAAREAWTEVRAVYGQTEVFRFYDGPIDDPANDYEGRINAWPLDEAWIDYTADNPDAGIINMPTEHPEITRDVILQQNLLEGEENVSAGWHAIEFLLWGQDESDMGPGARPATDYVDEGTAANQDRRRTYLELVTAQLVDDLTAVYDQWQDQAGTFRADFGADDPRGALRDVLTGMGALIGPELAGERMDVALVDRDQEQEHSCFSDTTHQDLLANAIGVQNIYLGSYTRPDGAVVSGPSISSLVAQVNPTLDDRVKGELTAAIAAIEAIPQPFDNTIERGSDEDRAKVAAAVDALYKVSDSLVEVAAEFDITLNLEI